MKTFILREDRHAHALWAFLKQNWKAMAEAGKPLQIDCGPERDTRSIQQNRLYWAILKTIEETGWIHGKQFTREAWHHYLRLKFLPCLDGPDGLVIPSSTTKLSVEEFNTYLEEVQSWAASELGVEFMGAA